MLKATYTKYTLNLTEERGTSRGWLQTKDSWYIKVWNEDNPTEIGVGECSYLPGLNPEKLDTYEAKVEQVCESINDYELWLKSGLIEFPSVHFGLETALLDLEKKGSKILFETPFSLSKQSIPINGLIWMGTFENMMQQVDEKIEAGFRCIKLKIGAIDFEKELHILKSIREKSSTIEIRVDANGAFSAKEALEKLKKLSEYNLHSIEQPIRQGMPATMNQLCKESPLPIALDEELIGKYTMEAKANTLDAINPPYIILKPSLIGGIKGSKQWIELAEGRGINWWITSALESNIGLNAISQFVATTGNTMFQGLGTGKLYTNNIPSPLSVTEDEIFYNNDLNWELDGL